MAYHLQYARWGDETYSTNWQHMMSATNLQDAIDRFNDDDWIEETQGDIKSNGKNSFRIIDSYGIHHHHWISLPYVGYPYLDLYGENPLEVIQQTYEISIRQFRDFCQRFLDETEGKD